MADEPALSIFRSAFADIYAQGTLEPGVVLLTHLTFSWA